MLWDKEESPESWDRKKPLSVSLEQYVSNTSVLGCRIRSGRGGQVAASIKITFQQSFENINTTQCLRDVSFEWEASPKIFINSSTDGCSSSFSNFYSILT